MVSEGHCHYSPSWQLTVEHGAQRAGQSICPAKTVRGMVHGKWFDETAHGDPTCCLTRMG